MNLQKDSQKNPQSYSYMAEGWHRFLIDEFSKPYMNDLRGLLRSEYNQNHTVYPPKDNISRALKLVDFEDVKVVILGQDPYHGYNQANGLAFAVEKGVSFPPSLKNIVKEIYKSFSEAGNSINYNNFDSTLENWAKQGVLLLNTVLTVRENAAFSHRGKGWEIFTDKVIMSLNLKKTPVVFLLWGSAAQSKTNLITSKLHKILKAPHPSPLSAHRGFLGCQHFTQANQFLIANNLQPIQWIQKN
jgi:uracil-DNA glycosylase